MTMITQYHRPATLDEAIALVGTSGAYVIVEGTASDHGFSGASTSAIDLQSLGLDGMDVSDGTLVIGAMATLASLSESSLAPPMIAQLAGREYSSAIRNAATVGGVIATNDPESELLAGLVAFDAAVNIATPDGTQTYALTAVLDDPALVDGSIIVDISIETRGASAAHRTGRTPMDRPIVLVVGHKDTAGHIRLAATGVASHVRAMSPGQAATLDPPSDFRGTSEYRRNLATVLTKRVLADLSGGGLT